MHSVMDWSASIVRIPRAQLIHFISTDLLKDM